VKITAGIFLLALLTLSEARATIHSQPVNCDESLETSLSQRSLANWEKFDQAFQHETQLVMNQNIKLYLDEKHFGNPYIIYLEKLGFQFSAEKIDVPSLSQIVKRQNKHLDHLIATGILKEDEVVRPARIFQKTTGEYIWIAYGKEIPVDAEPLKNLIFPDEIAFQMLASGYFAIGDITPSQNPSAENSFIVTLHDLSHQMSLALNPEFMKEMRKGTQAAISRSGGKLDPAIVSRWVTVFELGDVINPSARLRLINELDLSTVANKPKPVVSDVEKTLSHLYHHPAQFRIAVSRALDFYDQNSNAFGSAVGDVVNWQRRFRKDRPQNPNQSLQSLYYELHKQTYSGASETELIHLLARFELGMLESTKLTPGLWAREALQPEISPDSFIFRYICKSGIFTPGTPHFNAYCL
jgi:hypothetical protein